MNRLDHFFATLLWLLGILVVAGITHIVAIFALPEITARDTYARIWGFAKPGQVAVLPPARPDKQAMPFADPALVQSVCPYDLAEGGLRLHADVEADKPLSLSFRTSAGQVFYSMSDLAAQQGKMDVVVLTPSQLEIVEADDDDDDPSQDLRLIAPETKGFVIISAFAAHPSEKADAEDSAKSVTCAVEPVAQD